MTNHKNVMCLITFFWWHHPTLVEDGDLVTSTSNLLIRLFLYFRKCLLYLFILYYSSFVAPLALAYGIRIYNFYTLYLILTRRFVVLWKYCTYVEYLCWSKWTQHWPVACLNLTHHWAMLSEYLKIFIVILTFQS